MQKQQTLNGTFTLQGKGLHTGQHITAVFNPAPENHGYKIQRTDIEGQPIVDCNPPASPDCAPRCVRSPTLRCPAMPT